MESIDELRRKIDISQRYNDIIDILDSSECPICHNKSLKYEQHFSGSLDYDGCWKSKIICHHCKLLNVDYIVTGSKLYRMDMKDAGELQMLEGVYNKCKPYLN